MKLIAVIWMMVGLMDVASAASSRVSNALDSITAAQEKWTAAGLQRYSYSIIAGGAFGQARYSIRINGDHCRITANSRNARRSLSKLSGDEIRRQCESLTISHLMKDAVESLKKSFYCEQLATDPKYGFVTTLLIDTNLVEDQEWYFEIKNFKPR